MRIFFKSLICLTLIGGLLPQLAFSKEGAGSSGGGSAVVCFDSDSVAKEVFEKNGLVTDAQLGNILSIEALDNYEWNRPKGIQLETSAPLAEPRNNESFTSFFKRVIHRIDTTLGGKRPADLDTLGSYVPRLAEKFLNEKKQDLMWTGKSIVHLSDENTPIRFNDSCVLVPVAVQDGLCGEGKITNPKHNERFGNAFRDYDCSLKIFIDDRIFQHPKHSVQSKVAILLHELVYSYARKLGHSNSRESRRAVGLLMQNSAPNQDAVLLFDLVWELSGLLGINSPIETLNDSKFSYFVQFNLMQTIIHNFKYALEEAGYKHWTTRSPYGREQKEFDEEVALIHESENLLSNLGIEISAIDRSTGFNANMALSYLDPLLSSGKGDSVAKLVIKLEAFIEKRAKSMQKQITETLSKSETQKDSELISMFDQVDSLPESSKKLIMQTCIPEAVEQLHDILVAKTPLDNGVERKRQKDFFTKGIFDTLSYSELYDGWTTTDGFLPDWQYQLFSLIPNRVMSGHKTPDCGDLFKNLSLPNL